MYYHVLIGIFTDIPCGCSSSCHRKEFFQECSSVDKTWLCQIIWHFFCSANGLLWVGSSSGKYLTNGAQFCSSVLMMFTHYWGRAKKALGPDPVPLKSVNRFIFTGFTDWLTGKLIKTVFYSWNAYMFALSFVRTPSSGPFTWIIWYGDDFLKVCISCLEILMLISGAALWNSSGIMFLFRQKEIQPTSTRFMLVCFVHTTALLPPELLFPKHCLDVQDSILFILAFLN